MNLRALLVAALAIALPPAGWPRDARDGEAPIAWYPTWERGLRAAKSSGRPILLVSAAPQCHGIPGLW